MRGGFSGGSKYEGPFTTKQIWLGRLFVFLFLSGLGLIIWYISS